jgi:hypothetical protein
MQFLLMQLLPNSRRLERDQEITVDSSGQIITESYTSQRRPEKSTKIPSVPGITLLIHLINETRTTDGSSIQLIYDVPIAIRKSDLVLVGTDGRREIVDTILEILESNFKLYLEPFVPVRENLIELVNCALRIEDAKLMTEIGESSLDEVWNRYSFDDKSDSSIMAAILQLYPLIYADLIFRTNHKEILLRYLMDSVWFSPRDRRMEIESVLGKLEHHLLAGEQCIER